ncbi:hypothetical protein FHS96_002113 [Sphingomonas zeicaulis]|uniref:hypothetical protein n=1 Tax=Sphingomonas zeicaulis TaxID=1632740 RepID=UPI003D1A8EB1
MLLMHILRVRCEKNPQGTFFEESRDPAEIIVDAIKAMPMTNVGRGSQWHIAKPEDVSGSVGFKIGRTGAITMPKFDTESRDFVDHEVEKAPYTFGLFDPELQACGIIKKDGVSIRVNELAGKLERLLNSTPYPNAAGVRIVVDPIHDPSDFISLLRSSHQIIKFSFTASFPNPFDVESLIQGPAEKFTEAAGGKSTKIEVEGEDLNVELLEEVTRGVASTGDEASATVKPKAGEPSKRIHLDGNPLLERLPNEAMSNLYDTMRERVQDAYLKIRRFVP